MSRNLKPTANKMQCITGNTKISHGKLCFSQRGSALMLALVMIFMLSLMGVSAMRGSTLEKRMATNAIQTQATFQAAESASDLALNARENLTLAYQEGRNNELVLDDIEEVNTTIGLDSRSTLEYVGETLASGWSTGVGTQSFEGLLFIASGVSAIPAVRSQSTVEQGAYRIAPANLD